MLLDLAFSPDNNGQLRNFSFGKFFRIFFSNFPETLKSEDFLLQGMSPIMRN